MDEIKTNGYHMIFNGGKALEDSDCPNDYKKAHDITDEWNKTTIDGMKWSFDCGFKLDYDGDIVTISSRFYSPKKYYGGGWNGTVDIYVMDDSDPISSKKFDEKTLITLKDSVEKYILKLKKKIRRKLKGIK